MESQHLPTLPPIRSYERQVKPVDESRPSQLQSSQPSVVFSNVVMLDDSEEDQLITVQPLNSSISAPTALDQEADDDDDELTILEEFCRDESSTAVSSSKNDAIQGLGLVDNHQ